MIFPDKVYNLLKWIALIAIPALVTFLSVVLGVIDVDPKITNIIVTVIAAIGTLIGSLIGVSTKTYNKEKEDADRIFKANNGMEVENKK